MSEELPKPLPKPLPDERLEEIRDMRSESLNGDAPYIEDVWALEAARDDLLGEVDRLRYWKAKADEIVSEVASSDEPDRIEEEIDRLRQRAEDAEVEATTLRVHLADAQRDHAHTVVLWSEAHEQQAAKLQQVIARLEADRG